MAHCFWKEKLILFFIFKSTIFFTVRLGPRVKFMYPCGELPLFLVKGASSSWPILTHRASAIEGPRQPFPCVLEQAACAGEEGMQLRLNSLDDFVGELYL